MNEKQEALDQINRIKASLVDSQKFVPYAPNALIMWGVVTGFLFLFTQNVIVSFGIFSGALFLAFFIGLAAFIEYRMVSKVNQKYEIEVLTQKQKFIESIYIFKSIFTILMTVALAKLEAYNLIYPIWVFTVGFTSFIAGYVLNQKSFTYHGIASALLAGVMVLLVLLIPQGTYDIALSYLFRFSALLLMGGGYIWLGLNMKKEQQRQYV